MPLQAYATLLPPYACPGGLSPTLPYSGDTTAFLGFCLSTPKNRVGLRGFCSSPWLSPLSFLSFLKKIFFKFILRERGKEGERERNMGQLLLACPPTRGLDMCPDRESNLQPFDLQDDAHLPEPHHSGLSLFLFLFFFSVFTQPLI